MNNEQRTTNNSSRLPRALRTQVRRLHLVARRAVDEWLGGAYRSVFKGVGIAFEEVREYQPGDDVRAIDWNVTARTGAPYVKRFIEEREMTVMLIVDVGPPMSFGSGERTKRQVAAEAAALVALAAIENGDRVGLLLAGDDGRRLVPPRKGVRHGLRIVRDLLVGAADDVFAAAGRPGGVGAAMEVSMRVLKRRSLVVVASDFLREVPRDLRQVACRHDVVALVPHDPWERELPDVGLVSMTGHVGGPARLVDSANPAVRDAYRERMTARAETTRREIRRAGADCVELATNADPLTAVRRFFQIRERRFR